MPSTVEKLGPSRVKITVEVPFAELKPSLDQVYAEISKQIQVPGFRKGKVPPRVIDQRVGRSTVLAEAFNAAAPQFFVQAVSENDLYPLAQPEVEVTRLDDEKSIEFTAEVDVRPEFELPAADSLAVTVDPVSVTQADIDSQLDQLRDRFANLTEVDRAAATGDTVIIDLVGRQDGEILADANAEDLSYQVGAGNMLEGLDAAVTGKSVGESTTFQTQLLGGAHAGEEAEVTVTLKKVQASDRPELDDEFAKRASPFSTASELRDAVQQQLTQMATMEQASQARDRILEHMIENADFEVPEALLAAQIKSRHEQVNQQLAQAGLSLEKYLEMAEDAETEADRSVDKFWADSDKQTADAIKAQIILDKLADASQVEVEREDLSEHILRIAQQTNQDPQQVANHMVEHDHVGEYRAEIRRGKALAALAAEAKVTDTEGKTITFAAPARAASESAAASNR